MDKASSESIYMGLGANIPHPRFGAPKATLQAALRALKDRNITVLRVSPFYRSAPVPPSAQPWYVNAVAELHSDLSADALLRQFHAVEEAFGRVRETLNDARQIDLDLLDYRGQVARGGPGEATLPHPRASARAFVLLPLADLAPSWRHPLTGLAVRELIENLPAGQVAERLAF